MNFIPRVAQINISLAPQTHGRFYRFSIFLEDVGGRGQCTVLYVFWHFDTLQTLPVFLDATLMVVRWFLCWNKVVIVTGMVFKNVKLDAASHFWGLFTSFIPGWWFQIFFIFSPTWGRFPFWLIFLQMGEPTRYIRTAFLRTPQGWGGEMATLQLKTTSETCDLRLKIDRPWKEFICQHAKAIPISKLSKQQLPLPDLSLSGKFHQLPTKSRFWWTLCGLSDQYTSHHLVSGEANDDYLHATPKTGGFRMDMSTTWFLGVQTWVWNGGFKASSWDFPHLFVKFIVWTSRDDFCLKKSDFAIFFVETRNHHIFLTPACLLIFFPLRKFTADGSMSRNFRRSQGDWEVCNSCWILPAVEDTGGGFPCLVWESVVFFFCAANGGEGTFLKWMSIQNSK